MCQPLTAVLISELQVSGGHAGGLLFVFALPVGELSKHSKLPIVRVASDTGSLQNGSLRQAKE